MVADFLKLKFGSSCFNIDATNKSSSLARYVNGSPACYSNAVIYVFSVQRSFKVAPKLGIYEDAIFTMLV